MLSGGEVPQAGLTLQPFADVYRSMLNWQDSPHCLIVRYEDLAGPRGGGSSEQQWQSLQAITDFLGLPLDTQLREQLDTITDPSVPVFRPDQSTNWHSTVDMTLIDRTMSECAELAQAAGYPERLIRRSLQ